MDQEKKFPYPEGLAPLSPVHLRPERVSEVFTLTDHIETASAKLSDAAGSDANLVTNNWTISRETFGEPSSFASRLQKQLHRAHRKNKVLRRPGWLSRILQFAAYTFLACVIYFFLVGWPFWHGAIYNFWFAYREHFTLRAGTAIFIGLAFIYAAVPLLVVFERPAEITEEWHKSNAARASETAVIVPCYKSAQFIQNTLECALKTFPAANIFVVANGNSETPLDDTGEICSRMGVTHIWVPIGSKISAQYVGVAAAYHFRYCLLIDDDVALPDPFPVVSDRIGLSKEGDRSGRALVKCVGYTLEATDEFGRPGSLCQQAQNLEYKLAGLMRTFFSRLGSASFPHGAIALWERQFLQECFARHPGYRISEDWFFGLICKRMGGRIGFCSQVFVKTAVPQNLIRNKDAQRAGYGEMTVTSQRLWRWNFFLMARISHNIKYILFNWRLRQYEIFVKLDMFQEMYSSLLLLTFPFMFPVAVGAAPQYAVPLSVGVIAMYYVLVIIFTEVHLRLRGERVSRKVAYLYYPVYKLWLRAVNIASCYTSLFSYARHYSVRHPKVVDNERLLQYMLDIVGDPNQPRENVQESV